MRLASVLVLILTASMHLACSTAVQSHAVEKPVLSADKAYLLVQYAVLGMPDQDVEIWLGAEHGKDLELLSHGLASKTSTQGVVFEVPAEDLYFLKKMVVGDRSYVFRPGSYPYIHAAKGKIAHIGFFTIEKKIPDIYVEHHSGKVALISFKSALRKLRVNADDVINSYTGKPMVTDADDLHVNYQVARGRLASIEFRDAAVACIKDEDKINWIQAGVLRFHVDVKNGKVADVRTIKSEHTSSADYESCITQALRNAQIKGDSFSADLSGMLVK